MSLLQLNILFNFFLNVVMKRIVILRGARADVEGSAGAGESLDPARPKLRTLLGRAAGCLNFSCTLQLSDPSLIQEEDRIKINRMPCCQNREFPTSKKDVRLSISPQQCLAAPREVDAPQLLEAEQYLSNSRKCGYEKTTCT